MTASPALSCQAKQRPYRRLEGFPSSTDVKCADISRRDLPQGEWRRSTFATTRRWATNRQRRLCRRQNRLVSKFTARSPSGTVSDPGDSNRRPQRLYRFVSGANNQGTRSNCNRDFGYPSLVKLRSLLGSRHGSCSPRNHRATLSLSRIPDSKGTRSWIANM